MSSQEEQTTHYEKRCQGSVSTSVQGYQEFWHAACQHTTMLIQDEPQNGQVLKIESSQQSEIQVAQVQDLRNTQLD